VVNAAAAAAGEVLASAEEDALGRAAVGMAHFEAAAEAEHDAERERALLSEAATAMFR
jgi:hypothetical protein